MSEWVSECQQVRVSEWVSASESEWVSKNECDSCDWKTFLCVLISDTFFSFLVYNRQNIKGLAENEDSEKIRKK